VTAAVGWPPVDGSAVNLMLLQVRWCRNSVFAAAPQLLPWLPLLQSVLPTSLLVLVLLQVQWCRGLLFSASPPLLPWLLLWAGLPVSGSDEQQGQVEGLSLELMLRAKVLILVAVAIRSKAKR
jgi:hypothetical protein